MCRLAAWRWLGASVFCLSMILPVAATAQDARPTEAELLRVVDSLAPLLAQSEERLLRVEARRGEVMRLASAIELDTLEFGELHVITSTTDAADARRLIRQVLDDRFPGIEARTGLSDDWFVFQWQDRAPVHPDPSPWRATIDPDATEEEAREAIAGMIEAGLFSELMLNQNAISQWGISGGLGDPEGVAEWAYLDIAVTPSRLAPSCISGNAMDCWTLLGLDVDGDPLEVWYTPEQRRAVVGRWGRWGRTREIQAQAEECIWQNDLAACDEVLAQNTERRLDPLADGARNLMVGLALEAGGASAWARLLEDPEMTPAEALRHASGLSTEELAQRWIDVIAAARPEVHAGLGSLQFFTALWIGVLTFLTMRSTRWRLG